METVTLVLDVEIGPEDLAVYERCAGAIGVSGYANVVNVYYAQPLGRREREALAHAIRRHRRELGAHVLSRDEPLIET